MNIRFHRLRKDRRDSGGIGRRAFLKRSALAGATTGVLLTGVKPAAAALTDGQAATILQMVQDIYPHPQLLKLPHYQAIVATIRDNVQKDAGQAKTITAGLERLDGLAKSLFGTPYTGVADANAREGLLRRFQNDGFFQGIRWTAYFGIYDNKDIWPLFGYQGSSVEHGGYIDRGFSDITFVPEGPDLATRMAEVRK